jgi:heme exporter protein A
MPQKSQLKTTQIIIKDLVKRFHYKTVLNQLSLTLSEGNICLLIGDNGVGKTTLLRILASLVRPESGEIRYEGDFSTALPHLRQHIGYMGHQPMFYYELTACENLLHYAHLYQVQNARQVVRSSIKDVGLEGVQNQPIRSFSRGMLQRLSIARTLLHHPSFLLLDEPYTGLDQDATALLDRLLKDFCAPDKVILLTAHQPQRLLSLVTHLAWLQNGKITHHLPVNALEQAPELVGYLEGASA